MRSCLFVSLLLFGASPSASAQFEPPQFTIVRCSLNGSPPDPISAARALENWRQADANGVVDLCVLQRRWLSYMGSYSKLKVEAKRKLLTQMVDGLLGAIDGGGGAGLQARRFLIARNTLLGKSTAENVVRAHAVTLQLRLQRLSPLQHAELRSFVQLAKHRIPSVTR